MRYRQWSSLTVAIMALTAVLDGQAAQVEAATTSQVVTLSWEEAVRRPVPLTVGLGYIGLIRIRSVPIVSATDSPPGIVHVVARGDAALVVPVTVGQTSVRIGVGGAEVTTFLVTVTPNAAGAVVVEMSGPPRAAVGQHAAGAAHPSPSNAPTASAGPGTGQAAPADPPTVPPRQSGPGASTPGSSVERRGAEPGVIVTAPQPVAVTAAARKSPGALAVGYVIGNNTVGALELDPHTIRVRDASVTILVHQVDVDTPGVIPPGAVEAGLIVIPSPRDQVTITLGLRGADGSVLPVNIAIDTTALSSSPLGSGGQASQPQRREAPPVERVTMLLPTPAAGTTVPPSAPPSQGAAPASRGGQGIPESAPLGPPATGTSRAPLSQPQPVPVMVTDPTAQQMLTITAAAEGQTITVHYSIHNVSSTPLISRGIIVTDARGREIPLPGTEAAPLAPTAGGQTVQGVLHIPRGALPATIRWQWWGLFRTLWATAATLST